MKYTIKFFIYLISFFILISNDIYAHPGRTDAFGCHTCRTNCEYWGLNYGEYHCHNSKSIEDDFDYNEDYEIDYDYSWPVYIPYSPTPTPTPLNLNINTNYVFDNNSCTYTISASWVKPLLYNRFSVSAVKTNSNKCIDPGPISDTVENQFEFKNLSSGSYLINVKPGNQFNWDWYYYCVNVTLPKIKPYLRASIIKEEDDFYIEYFSKCANSIWADNDLGFLSINKNKIKIYPKQKTTYLLTAISKDGETEKVSLEIDPNATPTPTITPISTSTTQTKNSSLPFYHYGGASLIAYFLIKKIYEKIKNAKKP